MRNGFAFLLALLLFAPSSEAVEYRLASLSERTGLAGGQSYLQGISGDGRYVVFNTTAWLAADDHNRTGKNSVEFYGQDGYMYDVEQDRVIRVTVRDDGSELEFSNADAAISPDGLAVFFSSEDPFVTDGVIARERDTHFGGIRNVFRYDILTGDVIWITQQDGEETTGSLPIPISQDELIYIGFVDYIFYDVENNPPRDLRFTQVFYQRLDGSQPLVLNKVGDGGLYNYEWTSSFDKTEYLSSSRDVSVVAGITEDSSAGPIAVQQVFTIETAINEINIISTNGSGEFANKDCFEPEVSADGRFVAFRSSADNLIDGVGDGEHDRIYIVDRIEESIEVVPVPDDFLLDQEEFVIYNYDMTPDARYVVYGANKGLIYRFNRETNNTELIINSITDGSDKESTAVHIHCSDNANSVAFTTAKAFSDLDRNYESNPRYGINALDVYVAILEPESLVADWECY